MWQKYSFSKFSTMDRKNYDQVESRLESEIEKPELKIYDQRRTRETM